MPGLKSKVVSDLIISHVTMLGVPYKVAALLSIWRATGHKWSPSPSTCPSFHSCFLTPWIWYAKGMYSRTEQGVSVLESWPWTELSLCLASEFGTHVTPPAAVICVCVFETESVWVREKESRGEKETYTESKSHNTSYNTEISMTLWPPEV